MTTKKLFTLAISVLALSLSSAAEAKFVSSGEKFTSKVISERSFNNTGKTIDDYIECTHSPLKAANADVADDYDNAIANDPLEGFNRPVFTFNHTLDKIVLKPLAQGYRAVMPLWGRDRVSNVFNNIDETRNFINSALQFNGKGMLTSFWRFVINSTIGIGGMHDVAGGFGLQGVNRDFSTTLAYYGVETGPYLELPFFGPSTVRDTVGRIGDAATYPPNYIESDEWWLAALINAADVVQSREKILDFTDDLEADSFDLYSSYRASYLQNRKKNVQRALK
jgi:phospholipid-binding lipoprotein MlaA